MERDILENIQHEILTKEYEHIEEWSKKEINLQAKNMNIVHINVRSLNIDKWNQLKVYLRNFIKIDILILTEISLKEEQMDLFKIKNFKVYSYHRNNKKGGGIAVYIKDNIQASEVRNIQFKASENIEIKLEKVNMILNAVYRPPKMNVKEFINELKNWIKHKDIKDKELLIIGDININTLEETANKREYIDLLSSFGILNLIQITTREEILNGKIVRSCLDHINIRSKQSIKAGVIKEKIADHYFTFVQIKKDKIDDENRIININIIDEDKIKSLIEDYNWNQLLNVDKSAEILYRDIVNTFELLYQEAKKMYKNKKEI